MKRIVLSAAIAIVMAATLHASVSQVQITSLGVSGDKWGVFLKDSSGNRTGAYREKSFAVVSPYYESGCLCYHVPLTVLGFTSGQIAAADGGSADVVHYTPGSGPGCSFGYCTVDWISEILN